MVALRKPGKEDYTHPKSIGLLPVLGKKLEKLLEKRIRYDKGHQQEEIRLHAATQHRRLPLCRDETTNARSWTDVVLIFSEDDSMALYIQLRYGN